MACYILVEVSAARIKLLTEFSHFARLFSISFRYDAKYLWINLLGKKVVLVGISLYLTEYSRPNLVNSLQMEDRHGQMS